MNTVLVRIAVVCFGFWLGHACGQGTEEAPKTYRVPLVEGKPYLHVIHAGKSIRVERIQDPDYVLTGYFAKTSRDCPPFCLGPMEAAPGVRTVGEVEVFQFMENELRNGRGLLIDSRTPDWYRRGTIPGAINIPFTDMVKPIDDPVWTDLMKRIGAKPKGDEGILGKAMVALGLSQPRPVMGDWDLSDVKHLLLFCNGPACDQSKRAIRHIVAAGFPPAKLSYYRGGMQEWELWGLTTVVSND